MSALRSRIYQLGRISFEQVLRQSHRCDTLTLAGSTVAPFSIESEIASVRSSLRPVEAFDGSRQSGHSTLPCLVWLTIHLSERDLATDAAIDRHFGEVFLNRYNAVFVVRSKEWLDLGLCSRSACLWYPTRFQNLPGDRHIRASFRIGFD